MLTETFASIRRSIIAFAIADKHAPPPYFPDVVGTGFVIDTNGIVATNRHVVETLEHLGNPETADHVALGLTF